MSTCLSKIDLVTNNLSFNYRLDISIAEYEGVEKDLILVYILKVTENGLMPDEIWFFEIALVSLASFG